MNIILCEKNYFESNWCRQILSGLKNELKKRRMEYKILFDLEPFDRDTMLYVIGSDYRWISDAVVCANSNGIVPIVVFNQLDHIIGGRYHSVSSDISGTVASLVEGLKAKNKSRICLYGINPSSISDISRAESYFRCFSEKGRTFVNNGSLKQCFEDFRNEKEIFDAVICTNDLAAVSLVKNLTEQDPAYLDMLTIVSCSRSAISECYKDHIRSVDVNFTSFGINAYAISRTVLHGENISEIALTVKWDTTFGTEPPLCQNACVPFDDNGFYEDTEFTNLLKIDTLLERCDSLDKKIIGLLLRDRIYADIAEECHLVEQSVKYRVKQYIETCGLQNRKQLLSLLNQYYIKL